MAGTKLVHGRGNSCFVTIAGSPAGGTISGTTPIVWDVDQIEEIDEVGLQLIVEFPVRVFPAKAAVDNVVNGTKTWTFTNGNFVATDVGGTFTVKGSVSSDGTYTISSRTSSTVVVTSAGPGANETFGSGVTVTMNPPVATAAGTWLIEGSCDYAASDTTSVLGTNQQPTGAKTHWTDVTLMFTRGATAVANPDGSTAAKAKQYVQASILSLRALRYTFTPSSGAGVASVIRCAKSQS